MTLIELLLASAGCIAVYVTFIWLISLIKCDAGIMDVAWGFGFILVNFCAYFFASVGIPRQLVAFILVVLWGVRLSWHIGARNWGKPEDWRYAKWRQEEGKRWWWYSYFKVFALQGAVMWLVSLPLVALDFEPVPDGFTGLDYVGIALWCIGFGFEAIGDGQLRRFKKNPANKGKVLDTGLWRYTRHPNYFGECIMWWGLFFLAASVGAWWSVLSPILMTWLLVRVSGVSMLEEGMKATKPEYAAYIRRTSAFVPRPPR
jgi:steroid 5-alpha reductase family enzyme